jgi:hypothetical protein
MRSHTSTCLALRCRAFCASSPKWSASSLRTAVYRSSTVRRLVRRFDPAVFSPHQTARRMVMRLRTPRLLSLTWERLLGGRVRRRPMKTTMIAAGSLLFGLALCASACGSDDGDGGDDSAGGGSSGSGGSASTGGTSGTSGAAGTGGGGSGWQCGDGAVGCQCYNPPVPPGVPGGTCDDSAYTCCVYGQSSSSNPSQCFCGANADRCMVSGNAMTAAGLTVTDVPSCPPP